jgi:hypothetical protein
VSRTGVGLAPTGARGVSLSPSITSPPSYAPFAPCPLRHFLATMGALTPARKRPGRFPACPGHSLSLGQVSLLHVTEPSDRSDSNHLRLPWAFGLVFSLPGLPRDVPFPRARTPKGLSVLGFLFTRRLATAADRIEFVLLRISRSPPVALHLVSRRRSYLRLRGSDRASARTLTLRVRCAHRRTSAAACRCISRWPVLDGMGASASRCTPELGVPNREDSLVSQRLPGESS